MTMQDLFNQASVEMSKHSGIRWGQALMNALHHLDAQTFNKVVGTKHDCFYDNDRVDSFLAHLEQRLSN